MDTAELKEWLSRIQDLSVDELLTVQERVGQELKLKTLNSQPTDADAKPGNEASIANTATVSDSDLSPELQEELVTCSDEFIQ